MAIRLLMFSLGVLLLIGCSTSHEREATDLGNLQGTWEVVDLTDDGEAISRKVTDKWLVKFKENKMIIIEPEGTHEVTFRLDSVTKPKMIVATPLDGPQKDKILNGIYEIEGELVKICLPNRETIKMPSKFTSEKGSNVGLIILKRAKL